MIRSGDAPGLEDVGQLDLEIGDPSLGAQEPLGRLEGGQGRRRIELVEARVEDAGDPEPPGLGEQPHGRKPGRRRQDGHGVAGTGPDGEGELAAQEEPVLRAGFRQAAGFQLPQPGRTRRLALGGRCP